MFESFAYLGIPLFQRALLAGSVLAALLALLGVLVTARGLAYLGDGLSHAAFGGIALGMFLGLSTPLVLAIPFTAVAAMGIGALRRRGGLRSDVAMAILFAICFAASFLLNCRIAYASGTGLPRMRSITSRILRGDWRTER